MAEEKEVVLIVRNHGMESLLEFAVDVLSYPIIGPVEEVQHFVCVHVVQLSNRDHYHAPLR